MRFLKLVFLSVLSAAMGFVAITYTALEAGGVISAITTSHTDGSERVTHIWYVTENGNAFLEVGNPNNPWIQDLNAGSSLILKGDGFDGKYDFAVHDSSSHAKIRSLMRDKYGWRDVWVGWLFDTSQSYMIQVRRKL